MWDFNKEEIEEMLNTLYTLEDYFSYEKITITEAIDYLQNKLKEEK